ncbi:hypothetical protein ES705_35037 [subsurface metagenome]
MAVVEYNNPSDPNIPPAESIKNTISPITTGGNPIKVFIRLLRNLFPRNSLNPIKEPIGKETKAARNVEVKETRNETSITLQTSGFKVKIKKIASNIPSIISFDIFLLYSI